MKTRYKIIIWIVVTSLVCGAFGSSSVDNWLIWFAGLFIAKHIAPFIFAFLFGCLLYVIIYAVVFGGLFWILIS